MERDLLPSTQLSLREAVSGPGALPNEALERVAALYWQPVCKFVRLKFGKPSGDAEDLVQDFQRDFFRGFDPARASFRTYLRMAVARFAANQHAAAHREKRGGGIVFESAEATQPKADESPEDLFEQEWRRQVFSLALDDLHAHCDSSGKCIQWQIFEAYDLAENGRPSYAELAARHRIPETSVTNYLAWGRRMLRGFAEARLRGVTAGETELRREMRSLWS
jgi:RNA polymerase sigma factor (sigma-70 family)